MNVLVRVGAAVVGGYLLGRMRKFRWAVSLGGWLVGRSTLGGGMRRRLARLPVPARG
ncbi:hypothetical protein [Gandjariella thermophila]|uniref:Uncharacterized protein n=1 Tax=Gandjariella thermophila TaxID=1931992 RepID=A0A4D4J334_9PSEU|nr:hypothetical protein [Gandjariella thermophila]GDY28417.1 hypothetical protein GTS_00500 [Gandjariella thermophila]